MRIIAIITAALIATLSSASAFADSCARDNTEVSKDVRIVEFDDPSGEEVVGEIQIVTTVRVDDKVVVETACDVTGNHCETTLHLGGRAAKVGHHAAGANIPFIILSTIDQSGGSEHAYLECISDLEEELQSS